MIAHGTTRNILTVWLTALSLGGCSGWDRPTTHMPIPSGAVDRQMIWNLEAGPENQYSPLDGVPLSSAQAQVSTTPGTNPALVLYDVNGPYGFLGELYGIGGANLAGHFGGVTAKPVGAYTCGEVEGYSAVLYFGSTYEEPLPECFLRDVLATQKPVLWSGFNIWKLVDLAGFNTFVFRYGWTWKGLDMSPVAAIQYKGKELVRYAANGAGIMDYAIYDASKVKVLASAVRADGSLFPWAIHSDNLTYVGEIPFTYMSEEDRVLVFADLLFDLLAPQTKEQHRALVRLEDVHPLSDTVQLRAVADYLSSEGIPFGVSLIAEYQDPTGFYNEGIPQSEPMVCNEFAETVRYLVSKGGEVVVHGLTHQWSGGINPYSGVTGDDTEFYRVQENPDYTISFLGPLPEDSVEWAKDRLIRAAETIAEHSYVYPAIVEFPHYTASAKSYQMASELFPARWERSLYFSNQLKGGEIDHGHWFGQLFPYVVRDVYGSVVLPENLGNIEPEPFHIYPARLPAAIVRSAEKNLVVRDGFASFYFHPFFSIDLLKETVSGIKALGYTFVSPSSLLPSAN